MPQNLTAVIDTSVFIRFLLASPSALELWAAFLTSEFEWVYSMPIMEEFKRASLRDELGISVADAAIALALVGTLGSEAMPETRVSECRDSDDDKFLECALAAKAGAVVSMDEDLLALNPWRGIPILKPREFLNFIRKP